MKPTRGTLYEAGVRWQPPGRALLVSAAIYQIDQSNVVATDPVNPTFSTAGSANGTVPDYTRWDASARYDFGAWSFEVNATNLFDESYVTCTCGCFYGEPRRVVPGATANF